MKQRISKIIAFLCYWLGIDAIFYFLNRKAKRIVTFHNVMPKNILPQNQKIGLTDTEEEFRMKVRILKKRFDIGTDIADNSLLVITFDDGYKNQKEIAGRILREEGNIPAVVFVAGRMIDNNFPSDALVVDLLLHWTFLVPNGTYRLRGSIFEVTEGNRQEIWQSYIWPLFCLDNASKGRTILQELDKQYPLQDIINSCNEEYLQLRLTGVSSSDIKELREQGWIVGWHTQEHFPLSKLDAAEKRYEINSAPEDMKSIVFSYPYGELESVDQESIEIAEQTGYPFAVSNVEKMKYLTSNHFIPRMMLNGDFYQCHMQLSGLKFFLKKRRLL